MDFFFIREEKEIYLSCKSCASQSVQSNSNPVRTVETCRFRLSISLESLGDKKKVHQE